MDKEDIEYLFQERAAILEHDAGYTKAEAERLAAIEIFKLYGVKV